MRGGGCSWGHRLTKLFTAVVLVGEGQRVLGGEVPTCCRAGAGVTSKTGPGKAENPEMYVCAAAVGGKGCLGDMHAVQQCMHQHSPDAFCNIVSAGRWCPSESE